MEEKVVTITLSSSQRALLLTYEAQFSDKDLFRLVAIAMKKDDHYEIALTQEQLEDLTDQIEELGLDEEDEKLQDELYELCDFIEDAGDESSGDDTEYGEFSSNTGNVCIIKVALAGSKIWRKIAIREGQTLHDLHDAIFDAFDRYDEHMYSFFFPFKPMKLDPRKIYANSQEYTHPFAVEDNPFDDGTSENAAMTTVKFLELKKGQVFYYVFDFGDEWWHELKVEAVDEPADDQTYPRIIEKQGDSPEQYPDYEDDDED